MGVVKNEIVHANLTVLHNNKEIVLKEVVYCEVDGFYYNRRVLSKLKITEKVKVVKVDVLARLGFKHKRK